MQIKIAERLRPFCHLPGTYVMLPGSSLRLQIFPSKLIIDDLSDVNPKNLFTINFCINGPLAEFTMMQDLEKGRVQVWGKNIQGHFRYIVHALNDVQGLCVFFEKLPEPIMHFNCEGKWKMTGEKSVAAGQSRIFGPSAVISSLNLFSVPLIDRLSLGSHKSQDWELIRRRCDFVEILPFWHRLGQMIVHRGLITLSGTAFLLQKCKQAMQAKAPEHILDCFKNIFLTGFEGLLSPRLLDTDFHGISLPEIDIHHPTSSLQLLHEGTQLIRSLFIQEHEGEIRLLPALPPQFCCGRLLTVSCSQGLFSLEWTKKSLRCLEFHAMQTKKMVFSFSLGEKRCRIRTSNKDRGCSYAHGESFETVAGQNYWFDNFER